jgi:hypothetical protein
MKEKKQMRKMKVDWQQEALDIAEDAHDNNFSSRRGFGQLEGVGFYFYDNNPDEDRAGMLTAFRAWVEEQVELSEVGSAAYPVGGPDDGYTVALIIAGPPVAEDEIREALQGFIDRRWMHTAAP